MSTKWVPEGDMFYLWGISRAANQPRRKETDAKIIVLAVHVVQQHTITQVVIKSASGDADIIFLLISLLSTYWEQIVCCIGLGILISRQKMFVIDLAVCFQ